MREGNQAIVNILLIEDEYRMLDLIRDYLRNRGNRIVTETDGVRGMELALAGTFDVIILDIMLPGMDGFEILSTMRQRGDHTPVLILTARSSLEDKLKGFACGAEDYLTKPFDLEELEARLQVLGRKRGPGAEPAGRSQKFRMGNIQLNPEDHFLLNRDTGVKVLLPSKEYTLMEYFMTNVGQILSKEQITIRIWGYDSDLNYNNEEVYISFLRKKLEFVKADIQIETIRRNGYRLIEKR